MRRTARDDHLIRVLAVLTKGEARGRAHPERLWVTATAPLHKGRQPPVQTVLNAAGPPRAGHEPRQRSRRACRFMTRHSVHTATIGHVGKKRLVSPRKAIVVGREHVDVPPVARQVLGQLGGPLHGTAADGRKDVADQQRTAGARLGRDLRPSPNPVGPPLSMLINRHRIAHFQHAVSAGSGRGSREIGASIVTN